MLDDRSTMVPSRNSSAIKIYFIVFAYVSKKAASCGFRLSKQGMLLRIVSANWLFCFHICANDITRGVCDEPSPATRQYKLLNVDSLSLMRLLLLAFNLRSTRPADTRAAESLSTTLTKAEGNCGLNKRMSNLQKTKNTYFFSLGSVNVLSCCLKECIKEQISPRMCSTFLPSLGKTGSGQRA